MSFEDPIAVDQALFGYSDGHRQIEASIRLPSKDQYHLAAATDLASGVSLKAKESYLTGLPLNESRRFALIRTWPAPEMPRPGCVWSHVLLIEPRLLASHGNLADFLSLLKHPHTHDVDTYAERLELPSSIPGGVPPDRKTITVLIRQYYSGDRAILDPNVPAADLEAAIMAVWSQQWPRLRGSFSFRTASGAERRRSELVSYDVQLGFINENWSSETLDDPWIVAGADDAASRKVTPLRRFLWRYGRDLSSPRRHYRTLVELFRAVADSEEISAREAIRIFEAIPDAGDGEILKRDILGIGSMSPPLLPALAPNELLRLLISNGLGDLSTDRQLRKRFSSIPPSQVPALADFVERHGSELGEWADVIDSGLVTAADRSTLLEALPGRIRRLILTLRPELIAPDTLAPLSDEAFIDLATTHLGRNTAAFATAAVRRDLGSANQRLFNAMPSEIFDAAIGATHSDELNSSWLRTLHSNTGVILKTKWPLDVLRSRDVAVGLTLLRFPKKGDWTAEFWAKLFDALEDDVRGEDRLKLQAFLLRAALENFSRFSWKLVVNVLPDLRPVVLRGELPNEVYYMLSGDLPKFSSVAYWDIDKRILMSLSYLYIKFPDNGALDALRLSSRELNTVLNGANEEMERSKSRSWFWF